MTRGKIAVLFSQHGEDTYPNSFKDLNIFLKNQFSDCDIQYFIGDNSNSLTTPKFDYPNKNVQLFSTSNSAFEFSSWDQLYNINYEELMKTEFILFVSSAWQELYTGYLNFFSYTKLRMLNSHHDNFIVGHIDKYDTPGIVLNKKISHWIRTSFFIMSPNLPRLIGGLSTLQDINLVKNFISEKGLVPNFKYVDVNYFENIHNWLTGVTMQGNTWHSKLEKNDVNKEVFSRKFLSISNEHLLTKRIIDSAYAVFDVCFLSVHSKYQISIENQVKLRNLYLDLDY
jgi:hypothetical protein